MNNKSLDFSIRKYSELLDTLKDQGFLFSFVDEGVIEMRARLIILRQDVDLLPIKNLEFARIQTELGIRSTFYFRAVPESFDEDIIRVIAGLGHEVGYHYEDVSLVTGRRVGEGVMGRGGVSSKKYLVGSKEYEDFEKKLVDVAIESFAENLEKLRKIVPVKTICMHGSPMSRWDSRLLWKYYDYHDFEIVAEPYFDIDFDDVFYLTDTGRRWDGNAVSVRDKRMEGERGRGREGENSGIIGGKLSNPFEDWKVMPIKYRTIPPSRPPATPPSFPKYHSTNDIIKAVKEGTFPQKAMITMHPQRWTDKAVPWVRELVWQNAKNLVKYFLVRGRRE